MLSCVPLLNYVCVKLELLMEDKSSNGLQDTEEWLAIGAVFVEILEHNIMIQACLFIEFSRRKTS